MPIARTEPGAVYIGPAAGNVSAFAQNALRNLPPPASMDAMRPALLNSLFASLTSLTGIGPKLAALYAQLLGHDPPRILDLLFHLPSGAVDRRSRPKLRDVQAGQIVTIVVTVEEHRPPPAHRSRAPYRILAGDDHFDVFPRAGGLSREAAAGRRAALRLG